jgi:hypothetical protein
MHKDAAGTEGDPIERLASTLVIDRRAPEQMIQVREVLPFNKPPNPCQVE